MNGRMTEREGRWTQLAAKLADAGVTLTGYEKLAELEALAEEHGVDCG